MNKPANRFTQLQVQQQVQQAQIPKNRYFSVLVFSNMQQLTYNRPYTNNNTYNVLHNTPSCSCCDLLLVELCYIELLQQQRFFDCCAAVVFLLLFLPCCL